MTAVTDSNFYVIYFNHCLLIREPLSRLSIPSSHIMPSKSLRKSKSLPFLRMLQPTRQLAFVHLAPIPEVPLLHPVDPDDAVVDLLIKLTKQSIVESLEPIVESLEPSTSPCKTSVSSPHASSSAIADHRGEHMNN